MKTNILIGMNLIMLLLCCTLPTAASDYTLDIFGNANEDDTINMQDVTYTELIILEYGDQTQLADAKHDDRINMQDVTQIELIIRGREKELTLIDGLKNAYIEMEDWIEERMGDVKGDFQGGSIDMMTMEDVAGWKEKIEKIMKV